jgi:serine/threonine protein phosphatase PrpC
MDCWIDQNRSLHSVVSKKNNAMPRFHRSHKNTRGMTTVVAATSRPTTGFCRNKLSLCMGFGLILMAFYVGIGVGRIDDPHKRDAELGLLSTPSSLAAVPAWISEGSTVPFTGSRRCKDNAGRDDGGCKILFPAVLPFPTNNRPTHGTTSSKKGFGSTKDDVVTSSNSSLCTLKGQKGGGAQQNQDRILLIEPKNSRTSFVAGLFDGHGIRGETSSEVAARRMPGVILDALDDETSSFADFITDTFLRVDAEVLHEAEGGTTAFVMVQDGNDVHLAWVGDSKAFLVRWLDNGDVSSSSTREQINSHNNNNYDPPDVRQQQPPPPQYEKLLEAAPHKPSDSLERQRIESHGGRVFVPLHPLESSRVFYREIDPFGRVMEQGLAMSRSLGDKGGKSNNVVLAEPSYRSYTLPAANHASSGQYFVVLATDGVTDMVPESVLLTRIGQALFPPPQSAGGGGLRPPQRRNDDDDLLAQTCHGIVTDAANGWTDATSGAYRDDISLLFRRIEPQQQQRGR